MTFYKSHRYLYMAMEIHKLQQQWSSKEIFLRSCFSIRVRLRLKSHFYCIICYVLFTCICYKHGILVQDVALASLSIRPMPFAPILEKIPLTLENYGSIPRYYIQTTDDCALTTAVQENMVKLNPPKQVIRLKGSDHSPFFSKPQGLFKLLLEISQIKSTV